MHVPQKTTHVKTKQTKRKKQQNASTSTVRTAGSSQANPFACVASGIAALWGPAHGGANEAVLRMLQDIGTKARIPECIRRAKDKNDPFRCAALFFWLFRGRFRGGFGGGGVVCERPRSKTLL
jgi:hypothetical protein